MAADYAREALRRLPRPAAIADPRNTRVNEFARRRGRPGDDVDPRACALHQFGKRPLIAQPGYKDAARALCQIALRALDGLVEQRCIVPLLRRAQIQVDSRVDVERVASPSPRRSDSVGLQLERMKAIAADHRILKIASHRAGRG